jgi:hypothetical protein
MTTVYLDPHGARAISHTIKPVIQTRGEIVTDQEHEQRDEETSEEREETIKDLDVPEGQSEDVKGGASKVDVEYKPQ